MTEREEFEAAATICGLDIKRCDDNDGYMTYSTHCAWWAWKAARASQPEIREKALNVEDMPEQHLAFADLQFQYGFHAGWSACGRGDEAALETVNRNAREARRVFKSQPSACSVGEGSKTGEQEEPAPTENEVQSAEAKLYRDLTGDVMALGYDGIPAALEALRRAPAPAAGDQSHPWEYCPECGCTESEEPRNGMGHFCIKCGQEWHAHIDYSEVVRGNLERFASNTTTACSAARQEGSKTVTDAALTSAEIEAGWHDTFSTRNPFCPCDLSAFTKAARWAEMAIRKRQSTNEDAADARRYRWLRDEDKDIPRNQRGIVVHLEPLPHRADQRHDWLIGDELDVAIDAAMTAIEGGEG